MKSYQAACFLLLFFSLDHSQELKANVLEKFTVHSIASGEVVGEIAVYFNPKEYTVTKATPWKHHNIQGLDAPSLEFTSGEPYRCQFELFFDRYEEGKSVREITDKIERLTLLDPKTQFPPKVSITWDNRLWENRLLAAKTRFVDFAADGTPLAAVVTTLWSNFVLIDDKPGPGQGDPSRDPLPLTLSTPEWKVPATADPNAIDLLALSQDGRTVKLFPVEPHDLFGLSPRVNFSLGDPYRLQMKLQFDTGGSRADVRALTGQIEKLALVDPALKRPPTALLTWGTGLAFKCILESFSLRYTLFLDDGTPVRAVMNTIWKEYSPAEDQLKGNPRH